MSAYLHMFEDVPEGGKFAGWNGDNDPSTLRMSESIPVEELDLDDIEGDCRFVIYTIPGEESIPRINLSALPVIEGMGGQVVAQAVVLDLDRPGHAAWDTPDDATRWALDLLHERSNTNILAGVGIYTTRAGARLMWALETPIPVRQYRSLVMHVVKQLRDVGLYLEGEPEATGCISIDPGSTEWNRLWRMPCSMRDGARLQPFAELQAMAYPLDPYQFGELADHDDVSEVAGDAPEPRDDLTLDEWAAAYKHPYLKRGLPLPADNEGSTYPTLRRVIAGVASAGKLTDPEALFALVVRSVDATPGRTRQEAWKLCVWTAARERGAAQAPVVDASRPLDPEPLDSGTWSDWQRTVGGRMAPTINRLRQGLAFTPKSQAESKLLQAVFSVGNKLRLDEPLVLYRAFHASAQASLVGATKLWDTCVDVTAAVREGQEDTPDQMKAAVFFAEQPLLIAVPGTKSYFVLDMRDSSHPMYQTTDKDCLAMHYQQFLHGRLPFQPEVLDDSGQARPMEQLLLEYGNSSTELQYVTGQRGATFVTNRDGNRLEIGVHALHQDLRPVHHADVHEWLTLFGGSDPERFLDWLAVVTLTNFPTCALYVHGLPGSGKSMLLQGMAAAWGGSPVPFDQVAASFNASILNSPIIGADEGVPNDTGNLSEVFRNLVANSTHDVRIKYKPNATLHACMRLVITANEMDALDFKKTLSGRSLQAIVERVLFINQDRAPVDYLKRLGGRKATADWANRGPGAPGKIGEHLLWLRDNRTVESNGRFLVEGTMTDWHRQFIGQQGVKPDVIKTIAQAAKNAAKLLRSGTHVNGVELRRDKGCVFITKEAVVSSWAASGRDAPRERVLNKTLGQLDEKDSIGLARPRMSRDNPSAGTRAYAVSFDTLVLSQYVTMATLTGRAQDEDTE